MGIAYSALISACEKGKQLEQALDVFEAMRKQGVMPELITYNSLISACEKGSQLEQALKFFTAMKQQGVLPGVITYNALISACEDGNQLQRALELFATMKLRSVEPTVVTFNALMQVLAASGEIVAGFELLAQAKAFGSLSHFDENWYGMFRTLLEACRAASDSDSAARVQTAMEELGLFDRILTPVATARLQGLEVQYENGIFGDAVAEAGHLWLALRQQTAYMPQLQALPWAFAENSTRKQQEDSLKLHAEKKALAVLLMCGEVELNLAIEFSACMDCHEFFKKLSLLVHRRIQLHQVEPKMVHIFTNGHCSCSDRWRWEARLTPSAQLTPL